MIRQTETSFASPVVSACRRGRFARLLIVALLACAAGQAKAAPESCVPEAVGVPGLPGPPDFLSGSAWPAMWSTVDDPRWRGSLARSWGVGVSPHVTFRALRTTGAHAALYLSWVVKVAPLPDVDTDKLRVAFKPDATADAVAFEINPFPASVPLHIDAKPPLPAGIVYWTLNGATWTASAASPAWLTSDTRLWADTQSASKMWAVEMRIPVADTLSPGHAMSDIVPFTFEVEVSHPGSNVAIYSLDGIPLGGDPPPPPSKLPGEWTQLHLVPASSMHPCDGGIAIRPNDVGTMNASLSPHEISLSSTPQFFVNPSTGSGVTAAAHAVAATIRLANWGSTPADNSIATLWTEITPAPSGSPPQPPNNDNVIPPNSPTSTSPEISYAWTIPNDMRCDFTPNCSTTPRPLHQCILVELHDGPSPGGYTYDPSSTVRNMDFVQASTFQRDAEVSIAGLPPPPVPAPKRDVYLFLQTFQMPRDIRAPRPYSGLFDLAAVQSISRRADTERTPLPSGSANGPDPKRPRLGADFETSDQALPTYLVHVFHDTGRTTTANGQTKRILEPQPSFGYYVTHDGTLAGWDATLDGAQEIAPNYYHIAVAEGGSAVVSSRIVAREHDVALWLGVGAAVPRGGFAKTHRRGLAATLGLEYTLGAASSVEATLSTHRLGARPGSGDIDVTQFGVDGKWYVGGLSFAPFITLGAGVYAFDPGATRAGANAGVGVQVPIAPSWSAQARYAAHHVAGNAPNTNYSTLQLDLRHTF